MKTRKSVLGPTMLILIAVVLAPCFEAGAGQREHANRSLYIPLSLTLCEHLTEATLYIGDQAVSTLPAERIFQFTYYPALERLEPAVTEIRIEGTRSDTGEPFVGRLAVTPKGIYTANREIPLDFERAKKELAYKIDTRYRRAQVLMRCTDECSTGKKATEPVDKVARASLEESTVEQHPLEESKQP